MAKKKVLYLNEEAHAKAKKFCISRNLVMNKWIECLISNGINLNIIKYVPVKQDKDTSHEDAWTRKPFWEIQCKK